MNLRYYSCPRCFFPPVFSEQKRLLKMTWVYLQARRPSCALLCLTKTVLDTVRKCKRVVRACRGTTTFSKLGVQFLGVGYCTEQNADGIPSFMYCSLQLRKMLGWSIQILGVRTPRPSQWWRPWGHVLGHESLLKNEGEGYTMYRNECTCWAIWWKESMWHSKEQERVAEIVNSWKSYTCFSADHLSSSSGMSFVSSAQQCNGQSVEGNSKYWCQPGKITHPPLHFLIHSHTPEYGGPLRSRHRFIFHSTCARQPHIRVNVEFYVRT